MLENWRREGGQPRRLLCFSVAFFLMSLAVCGIFLGEEDLLQVFLLSGAIGFGLAAAAVLILREGYRSFSAFLIGLLAGWLWCCGYLWLVWQPSQSYDGRSGLIRVELTEPAEGHVGYGVAYGLVTRIDGQPCRLKVKAYLLDGSPEGQPGDLLEFPGELQAAGRDWRRNLLQEGRFLVLRQTGGGEAVPGGGMTLLRAVRRFAGTITRRIGQLLPGDEGALLAGMISGDRSGFSRELDQALTISGARHITAVSGLHVSILAGMLLWLLGKRAGLLAAVPLSLFYCALVGFSPSVVRAAVLLIFWAGAFWFRREKDSLTALAAALLLLVGIRPFSALSAGLLLSFSATLGLILLSGPLKSGLSGAVGKLPAPWLKKPLSALSGGVAATLAATLFTLPMNLLFFDTVPLMSLVSNLLILWALALILTLGMAVLSLSLVWPGGAAFLARWVVRWPLLWVVKVIHWVAGFQFAATDSANLSLALAGLAVLTAVLLWRGKRLSGKRMVLAAGLAVLLAALWTAGSRMLYGQLVIENCGGQPVFLIRGEGVSIINSGTAPDQAAEDAAEALIRWNQAELETLLCTTGDYRTQGGLPVLLERVSAQRLLLPAQDGTVPSSLADYPVLGYSRSGTTRISGLDAQLLKGGTDVFALRLVGNRFSLLSLCGLTVEQALAVTREQVCTASLLVVDDRLGGDWEGLLQVCRQTDPDRLLVVTNGYLTYEENFNGIPVTLIQRDRVSFRFLR